LHDLGVTFLGRNCSQSWADFLLWERLLNAHPELKTIVELGTGEGGFSRYLWLQAEARGLRFHTFDRVRMDGQKVPGFRRLDIFKQSAKVRACFRGPTVLFCDDGDKPREISTFAPLLRAGDLVVVHDWDIEIHADQVPAGLAAVHEDWCDELRSHSRVFVKETA
jgi:cephalosporin hydroxylase